MSGFDLDQAIADTAEWKSDDPRFKKLYSAWLQHTRQHKKTIGQHLDELVSCLRQASPGMRQQVGDHWLQCATRTHTMPAEVAQNLLAAAHAMVH